MQVFERQVIDQKKKLKKVINMNYFAMEILDIEKLAH